MWWEREKDKFGVCILYRMEECKVKVRSAREQEFIIQAGDCQGGCNNVDTKLPRVLEAGMKRELDFGATQVAASRWTTA